MNRIHYCPRCKKHTIHTGVHYYSEATRPYRSYFLIICLTCNPHIRDVS